MTSATDARGIPHDGIPHVAFVGRSNVGKSSLLNALVKRDLARTSAAAGKTRLANLYRVDVEGGPGGPGHWTVYFADLPGYGYARGGRQSVEELRHIAEAYFSGEAGLKTRPTEAGMKTRPTEAGMKTRPAARGRPDPDVGRVFRPGRHPVAGPGRHPIAGPGRHPIAGPGGHPIAGVLHLVDSRHPGLDADLDAARWLQSLPVERMVLATKIDKLSRGDRVKNLRELERQLGMAPLPISATSGEGLDDLWTLIARLSR